MRKLSPALFLLVYSCQTVGLPLDAQFPDVPEDIKSCAKTSVSAVPERDLSAHEVEILWKSDRFTAVNKGRCLNRLIVRDRKLAGKP